MAETLGSAIRRLRLEAGYTLRAFAKALRISAAHQSDIEHSRRLPSDKVLRATASALSEVGVTYDSLRALDARVSPDLQEWVQRTPGVDQLLRQVKDSGRSPRDILRELQRLQNDARKEGEP